MIKILGIPWDKGSSFRTGCSAAPELIRQAYHCPSSNQTTESGLALDEQNEIFDQGNLDVQRGTAIEMAQQVSSACTKLAESGDKVLILGGDHSITFPILKGLSEVYGKISLLQLDAHSDLYDSFQDDPYSHASPFARAHEAGLLKRHVQVGIRTMSPHLRMQSERFGVDVRMMKDFAVEPIRFEGPTYITLDLDILDPAFAPGISHYEPGGATTRDVIQMLHNVDAEIIGADIVEYNPARDMQQMTAYVAAKLMKELLGRLLD